MTDWLWWYSFDGGERYRGPCVSREQAIQDGRDEVGEDYDYEEFEICEARKGRLQTALFRNIGERLDDLNDDVGDPEGDANSADVTDAQWRDLERRLNDAVSAWADANDIHKNVWMFAETRNHEIVKVRDEKPHD